MVRRPSTHAPIHQNLTLASKGSAERIERSECGIAASDVFGRGARIGAEPLAPKAKYRVG